MSKKQAERIVKARENAPERLRGADFDAWLLELLLETLEPAQRDFLEFLLIGVGNDVPVSTQDLCEVFGTTANRMGATVARPRRLHLIATTHQNDEHGRTAFHAPAAWVRLADRYRVQMVREAWAAAVQEVLGWMTTRPVTALRGGDGAEGSLDQNFRFYIGLHQPSDARHFTRCCIHVGRLIRRQKPLSCAELLMDSQAFRVLELYGDHRLSAAEYAAAAARIATLCARIVVVCQDYPCEQYMFQKRYEHTGIRFTIVDHQRLTIARYDELRGRLDRDIEVLPVLQGYHPREYVDHIRQYGRRLRFGAWVGVGSVCKRNSDPAAIRAVLLTIKAARPDLRLHGFGVKITALASPTVRQLLWSADSLAWSMAARKNGRNANDWREAAGFAARVEGLSIEDLPLFRQAA